MKSFFVNIMLLFTLFAAVPGSEDWKIQEQKKYSLYYTSADAGDLKIYGRMLNKGVDATEAFFGQKFKARFRVFLHPGRVSLDSTWRADWKMPGFRSECWMVASGVAARLDLLSPRQWAGDACEHVFSDRLRSQQVFTHELIHVFHGQRQPSPDFSSSDGIDWLVEGLATYASGQCDSSRLSEVRNALVEKKVPASLDRFWTGKLRYGISGSMLLYIDKAYGRSMLLELLPLASKTSVLKTLNISEEKLIADWSAFILK